MTEIIDFYVPVKFKSKQKYVPLAMRGKILQFPSKEPVVQQIGGLKITVSRLLENLKKE